jgi:hypothetical protein
MVTKTFSRAGLERLSNLIDLPDPEQAVTNILSGMKADSGLPFNRRNLDPLVGLSANGFPDQGLNILAGAAPKQTVFDPDTNISITSVITPVVTIADTLRDVEAVQGGPPDLGGGLGPRARYYNMNQIDILQPSVVFTGNPQAQDQLDVNGINPWGRGNLLWNGQLHPSLNGLMGGVMYEGYLNTSWFETSRINLATNAYFILEVDQLGTGTLNVLREFRELDRTITCISGILGNNNVTLDAASAVKVFVGDQFTTAAQSIPEGAQVTEVNMETGVISLSVSLTGNITSPSTETYTVTRLTPVDVRCSTALLQVVPLFPALFRCQVWWTDDEGFATQKNFNIDLRSSSFTYKYLFPPDFNFTPASNLKQDYLSGVKLYGGNVGMPESSGVYENLKTLKSVTISYVPPISLSVITFSGYQTLNSNRLFISQNFNVMLGARLFSTTSGFPNGCIVTAIRNGNTIIMSDVAQATGDVTSVRAVPPQGFYTSFLGSGSITSTTIQLPLTTPVSSLWETHIIFCDVAGVPTETVIDSVDLELNTITISKPLTVTISAGSRFFVYYSSGLVDNSLTAFCPIPDGEPGSNFCTPNPTLYLPFDSVTSGLSTALPVQLITPDAVIRWNNMKATLTDPGKFPASVRGVKVSHIHEFKTPNRTYKLMAVKLS